MGTDSTVISNNACYISLATLRSAPFNLQKDESVYAKVKSINTYGESY